MSYGKKFPKLSKISFSGVPIVMKFSVEALSQVMHKIHRLKKEDLIE